MQFKYVARHKITGKRMSGVASAANVSDLTMTLKQQELLPLKVYADKVAKSKVSQNILFKSPVTGKELAIFTRQLAATLTAGLLLTEALETIADDLENAKFCKIIRDLRKEIQSGVDFSSALSKYPKIFPVTYISIVKSGEATGSLHITMTNLAQYLENTERLKEKVKSAVQYPSFVVGFACLVVMVIVFFLIPKFQAMFFQVGAQLPLLTRIVVNVSEFAFRYSPFLIVGGIALVVLFLFSLKFYKCQRIVDSLKLKVPIIGKEIIHKALVSRFCRTLGFLFAGGVPLSKSLEITRQVVNHTLMAEAIEQIRSRVVAGASLSDEIKNQKIFPRLTAKMTSVGERTGKLSEMLTRTSDYYDDELDSTLQNLTTMIEPALIIFVGGVVLIVVLALYLPIFQMSSTIH